MITVEAPLWLIILDVASILGLMVTIGLSNHHTRKKSPHRTFRWLSSLALLFLTVSYTTGTAINYITRPEAMSPLLVIFGAIIIFPAFIYYFVANNFRKKKK